MSIRCEKRKKIYSYAYENGRNLQFMDTNGTILMINRTVLFENSDHQL